MDCCSSGFDDVFTERQARRLRRRYERRGLTGPGRPMVRWLRDRGLLQGCTVLEVGGGLGELHPVLLQEGAVRITNVELTRTWEAEAQRLLTERGVAGRVDRVLGDLVRQPGLADAADVVILNRVVCCYPDHAGLLRAAGDRARRALVLSHPPRTATVRAGVAALNTWESLRGRDYRAYAHPPEEMLSVLAATGLRPVLGERAGLWWVRGLERAA